MKQPTPAPGAPAVPPKPTGCKKKMFTIEDKGAALNVANAKNQPDTKSFSGLKRVSDTSPLTSKPGDNDKLEKAIAGNFTKAQLDQEVKMIAAHELSPEDVRKTEVKAVPWKAE